MLRYPNLKPPQQYSSD